MRTGRVGGWKIGMGAVAIAAAIAAGAGATMPGGGGAEPRATATLDPTCILGPAPPTAAEAAAARWLDGLIARSDELNRQNGLGRYAPGGPCADIPDWFRALVLRSDALNREGGLGDRYGSRK